MTKAECEEALQAARAEIERLLASERQLMADRDDYRSRAETAETQKQLLDTQLLEIDKARIRDADVYVHARDDAFQVLRDAISTIRFPCTDCRPFIERARMILGEPPTWR